MKASLLILACAGLLAAALAFPWASGYRVRGGVERAVEEGIDGLRAGSFDERERSARRLRSLGEDARPALVAALADADAEVRLRAALILSAIDRDREPHEGTRAREYRRLVRNGLSLQDDLRPGTERFRLLALDPPAAARAAVEVARTVEEDPLLLQRAVILLVDLREAEGAPFLAELLGRGFLLPSTLHHAAEGLRVAGGAGELPLVREAARSPDPESRRHSIRVLAVLGEADDLPLLRSAAVDPEERVRREVPPALARLGAEAAVPDLTTLARDPSAHVRSAALDAMVPIPAAPVRQEAVRGLADGDPEVRAAALRALRARGIGEDAASARPFLADPSPLVRGEAVLTVSALGRPEVAVFAALTDDSPAVRRVALLTAKRLSATGRRKARELLAAEPDPYLASLRDRLLGGPGAN